MPAFPRHLAVSGLFGALNPEVKFRLPNRITILAGPNGSGKTHVLRILRHLLAPDLNQLARLPFAKADLEYDSGKLLTVRRQPSDSSVDMHFEGRLANGEFFTAGPYAVLVEVPEGLSLPPFIERMNDDWWIDTRDGEPLTLDDLIQRFGQHNRHINPTGSTVTNWPPSWLTEHFSTELPPTFIETGRLDPGTPSRESSRMLTGSVFYSPGHSIYKSRPPATAARIRHYVDRIRMEVAEARRTSLAVSQRADQEFAAHALDKARATVKEAELRDRYDAIATLHAELHDNGLTEESIGVVFPGDKANPTERRILNVFLSDWEEKLRPLLPVHQKLQLLRGVVGEKLRNKSLLVVNGEPQFESKTGEPIAVEALSSGEQHLLALFTMLLFVATPGSMVLIDEPEISLHAAWKHAFLDDITRVAHINDLQVILATHSTAIINGRWELVEELELPV